MLAVAGGAGAQPLEPSVVIVVDFQAVIRDCAAAKTIQAQIDERRSAFQTEFAAIEQQLRDAEAQLSANRSSLSEDDFNAQRRDFEQRVVDAQRDAQTRHTGLDQALDQAMDQVRSMALQVIADIAGQVGAKIVLNKSQVILTDRSLDFSQQVLDQLNQRLPRVDIVMPAP